jgi:hypothetical protein
MNTVVPLAFIIGGYLLFFLMPWHESSAAAPQTKSRYERDRRLFGSVPTRRRLPALAVERLEQLAARELRRNPQFRKLIRDLRRHEAEGRG